MDGVRAIHTTGRAAPPEAPSGEQIELRHRDQHAVVVERLRDGRYTFVVEEHQLPLTEPAKHNAIHGLVRLTNWTIDNRAQDRVCVRHVLHPQPGWPSGDRADDLRPERAAVRRGVADPGARRVVHQRLGHRTRQERPVNDQLAGG